MLLATLLITVTGQAQTSPTSQWVTTSHQLDGNRYLAGAGQWDTNEPLFVSLQAVPEWLVGARFKNGALWVAVSAAGQIQAFEVRAANVREVTLNTDQLPAGMPPLLHIRNDQAQLLVPTVASSPWSHPVWIAETQAMVTLSPEGQLVVERNPDSWSLEVDALPDARLIVGDRGRLALITQPTEEYRHNVLGDPIEGKAITLVTTQGEPSIERVIPVPAGWVIEGIAPIWADLNGDGQRELIVTLSRASDGGKIVVYDEAGNQVAEGPGIGRGFRWRNQMAVAPYGPNGELELSAVLTPHIGGTVEFYRWEGANLIQTAALRGFTSHVFRSRNLDLSVSLDLDGNGHPVVLLPNDRRTELAAIRHQTDGAIRTHTLPLEDRLATNPAAVRLADGTVTLAAGLEDARLQIWPASETLTQLQAVAPENGTETFDLRIYGTPFQSYTLQQTHDFNEWQSLRPFTIENESGTTTLQLDLDASPASFFRAIPQAPVPLADVTAAEFRSQANGFTASVTIQSPDTGCEQYADWWEIISETGELLYRRILAHSHVTEQPFTRSGGPVPITETDTVYIRAHMHPGGYGGQVLKGSMATGFQPQVLSEDFASDLETLPPLPSSCAF